MASRYIERVVDLLDPAANEILNMSIDDARQRVFTGDPAAVRGIDGAFALLAKDGTTVRMARSMDRPMRYFLAKRQAGPALFVADRIDTLYRALVAEGLDGQFHPSYTRMVPAHHVVELQLIGCPDPDPTYTRFFTPLRGVLPANLDVIGQQYIGALAEETTQWLRAVDARDPGPPIRLFLPGRTARRPLFVAIYPPAGGPRRWWGAVEARDPGAPIGVCFSGGIDSGAVFVTMYHAMLKLGMAPTRLKAFVLNLGAGPDVAQARDFLARLGLSIFLEEIEASPADLDLDTTLGIIEDYKPLDVECAAMSLLLCRGIRARYPEWRYLADGDGGDENLKDYPIEENPELTIRSVVDNLMLYQEGWGVGKIKHSLTYSGGLSRA